MRDDFWSHHHAWAGEQFYSMAIDLRGFYLKVISFDGLENMLEVMSIDKLVSTAGLPSTISCIDRPCSWRAIDLTPDLPCRLGNSLQPGQNSCQSKYARSCPFSMTRQVPLVKLCLRS